MSRFCTRFLSTIVAASCLLALADTANAFGHHRRCGGGYGGCGYGGYGGCGSYGGYGYGGYGYGYAGYGYGPYTSYGYPGNGYYAMPAYTTRPSISPTQNVPAPAVANRVIPAAAPANSSPTNAPSPPSPSDQITNGTVGLKSPAYLPSGTPNALVGR